MTARERIVEARRLGVPTWAVPGPPNQIWSPPGTPTPRAGVAGEAIGGPPQPQGKRVEVAPRPRPVKARAEQARPAPRRRRTAVTTAPPAGPHDVQRPTKSRVKEVTQMAPKPTDAQKKRNAAAAVRAALAEGKIIDASAPAWRVAMERAPEKTRAELRQLVAVDPRIHSPGSASATTRESRLLQSTRAVLGLAPSASSAASTTPAASPQGAASGAGAEAQRPKGGQGAVEALRRDPTGRGTGIPSPLAPANPLGFAAPLPPAGAGPSPAARGAGESGPAHEHLYGGATAPTTPRAAELTRTEHGSVLYGGVPTRMSDRGTRQVYYFEWLDVADFEQRGLLPEHSAMAIQATQSMGTADAQATLAAGMPAGSALGVV
jgi:hypothetical protein